jgi:hypothetical protein
VKEEKSVATTDANGATIGTSLASLFGAGAIAWIIAGPPIDLQDLGYLSREIVTGFPELRFTIRNGLMAGWKEHHRLWKGDK